MRFLLDHDVPDDLSYLLAELGHHVTLLREVLPPGTSDVDVLDYAYQSDCLLVTCNRDDFLRLAEAGHHRGIVVIVRRRTRAAERAALLRLLERAGPGGLESNINFAWPGGDFRRPWLCTRSGEKATYSPNGAILEKPAHWYSAIASG